MTLKDAIASALNIVEFEGDQLEIDFSEIGFDLDRPQLSLCPKCDSEIIQLSNSCAVCGWSVNDPPKRKTRRSKGEGSGHIQYRTVTRNGKHYYQAYYHWRDSEGKQRTKYIPVKLLDEVWEAEFRKQPVEDILVLLGCIEKCCSKSSDTNSKKCCSKNIHPSKKRREKGRGTAYIECKPITKNGKQYKQYWFHWEVWQEGDCVVKKSRYIPKRLVPKAERMNQEKVSVSRILEILGVKG